MAIQEFECKDCRARFPKVESCGCGDDPELKCPHCGSINTEKAGDSSGTRRFLRDLLRPT